MLIGIFGGTFDPIHKGHINLAENLLEKTKIEKILFIPSSVPPHKPKIPISSFKDRFNMVKLAIENNSSFAISDIENRNNGPSYTVKTLQYLKEEFPDDNFTLIIGGDSLAMLHSWYKAAELVKECTITAYPRPGYNLSLDELKLHWDEKTAQKLFSSIVDLPVTDLSATEVRSMFYNSKEIQGAVQEKVKNYIIENNLYA